MKGGVEAELHSFLTSVLNGRSSQLHASDVLSSGKEHYYPLNMGLDGHQNQCRCFGGEMKLLPKPGFDTPILRPVA
jgi:hypothetical protein